MSESMIYDSLPFDRDSGFLVTGAAGFIGANLVEAICRMGYGVRGLDNYVSGRRETVGALRRQYDFDFIEGDIRDESVCRRACENIDYVLHQAAWSGDARSMDMAALFDSNNVHGTVCLMEAAVRAGAKRFVYASSSSVYGDSGVLPRREGAEGACPSPFAFTKKSCEGYASFFGQRYGLDTVGLRYFEVCGRRQDPRSASASAAAYIMDCLLREEMPVLHGGGGRMLDLTYIDDVIEANLRACLAPSNACGRVYNIATGQPVTHSFVHREISRLLDIDIDPVYRPLRPGESAQPAADIGSARRYLGYEPRCDCLQALERTVQWLQGPGGPGGSPGGIRVIS